MHAHSLTLLHHVSQMLYVLDHELFQAFSILVFLPVNLVQVDQPSKECFSRSCLSFWKCFFFCQSLINLYLEPSVFALVKSSLDCRLWQWHNYLLESVLHLAGCCKKVFLYHGEDPLIIHHCCPLWTSMPFYVAELTSTCFFFGSLTIVCFTCMERSFDYMM